MPAKKQETEPTLVDEQPQEEAAVKEPTLVDELQEEATPWPVVSPK